MPFFKKVMAVFRQGGSLPAQQQVGTGGSGGSDTGGVRQDRCAGGGPSIWPVHPDVQRMIQKGTDMNMKAVVCGMRRTGKSTIVSWLCGYILPTAYTPSAEISAGTIYYRSRMGKSVRGGAKVELWDVVDEGFRTGGCSSSSLLADARSIDVYRSCHLAIFVVDRTRKETLEYAVREAHHVPPTTCILFVLNFHDAPKSAHVVRDRDIENVCRSLRRATTPMILAASAGRAPPEDYSASATWVDISALTGYGMELLRTAFEIPYVLHHVLDLESQINSHFQYIEQYQAWAFTERANLHFLEDSGRTETRKEEEKVLIDVVNNPSETNNEGCSVQTPEKEVIHFSLNRNVDSRGKHRADDGEEDENGITKGFFDGFEEDETGKGTRIEESVLKSNSISANESGGSSKTPVVSPSLSLSMGKGTLNSPPSARNALLDAESEWQREKEKLGGRLLSYPEKMLDVGEDVDLDDAFFESSTRDEPPPVGTSLGIEHGNDDDDDDKENECVGVVTKLSVVGDAETALPTTSNLQEVSSVSTIQLDVDVLLRQMQSALGVACVGGEGDGTEGNDPQICAGKCKNQSRRKGRRGGKRDKSLIHGEQEKRGGELFNTEDDGTFELIRE